MSYESAIKGLGIQVTLDEHIGSYQGDWVAVLYDDYWGTDHKHGFLVYGYGSCSGCDEWEAAENVQDRYEILGRMLNRIKWFETVEELKAYVADPKHSNEFYYDEDWNDFAKKVAEATKPQLTTGNEEE